MEVSRAEDFPEEDSQEEAPSKKTLSAGKAYVAEKPPHFPSDIS